MSTATMDQVGGVQAAVAPLEEALNKFVVKYVPMGATEEIELKFGSVKRYLSNPTKSGKMPTDGDIVKFMMLCKARALNPWEGDAFLVGYDSNDGPVFNLITAVQSLLKRAELSDDFDGIESGIVVAKGDQIIERAGQIVVGDEKIVGGWAKVHRKDNKIPFYASVQFKVYDTGRSRWAKDPAGMIQKVAKAAALREAFPNMLSGLYTREESDTIDGHVVSREQAEVVSKVGQQAPAAQLATQLREKHGVEVATKTQQSEPVKDRSQAFRVMAAEIAQVKDASIARNIRLDVEHSTELSDSEKDELIARIDARFTGDK